MPLSASPPAIQEAWSYLGLAIRRSSRVSAHRETLFMSKDLRLVTLSDLSAQTARARGSSSVCLLWGLKTPQCTPCHKQDAHTTMHTTQYTIVRSPASHRHTHNILVAHSINTKMEEQARGAGQWPRDTRQTQSSIRQHSQQLRWGMFISLVYAGDRDDLKTVTLGLRADCALTPATNPPP